MKKLIIFFGVICIVLVFCSTAFAEKYIVNTVTDPLRVRSAPGGGYVIGHVAKGSTLNVIEHDKWWAKINYKGGYGYVSMLYLKHFSGKHGGGDGKIHYHTESTKGSIRHVKYSMTGYLNVRAAPTRDSKSIGKLYAGDEVKVTSTTNGWSKIIYKGGHAYVKSEYLVK